MFTAGRAYLSYPGWGNLKRVIANSTLQNNSMVFTMDQLNRVRLYTLNFYFVPNFNLTKAYNISAESV